MFTLLFDVTKTWCCSNELDQRALGQLRFVKAGWGVLPAKNWSQLFRPDSGGFGVVAQLDFGKANG
jgi:hypothetical protein